MEQFAGSRSGLDRDRFAAVRDSLRHSRRANAHPVLRRNQHDAERSLLQHSRKAALARANRQRVRRIVPVHRNRRVDTFLVIVVIVLIFIEGEVAIRVSINP